jgi:hypothetical protein
MYWWILPILSLLGALALWRGYASPRRTRRLAAIALLMGANTIGILASRSDVRFWRASAWAQTVLRANSAIDVDKLWGAQPRLLAQELDALQPRVAGRPNVYAIAVAAQGSQQIFSREAQLALQVAAGRFGGNYRGGVFLSNGAADLYRHPLATQDSIAAVARGIADRMDPRRDVAVVYLTSHGSPESWLATDLPDRRALAPISSRSLAEALSQAGIKRRVVIISACFSGGWIPALASDDTIVISAAAKDRTSFGCNDTRRLTFFGEALLEGPLARGASLREAFAAMRTTVARWEEQEKVTPSLPQASVGRNMQALWAEGIAPRKPARRAN